MIVTYLIAAYLVIGFVAATIYARNNLPTHDSFDDVMSFLAIMIFWGISVVGIALFIPGFIINLYISLVAKEQQKLNDDYE